MFQQYFSLSKRTVHSLCDELDPIIGCQRASGHSTERKVLCALRFFGAGSFQRSVGREEHIGMAQSAVSSTIHEVTEAVISVSARRKLVDFPFAPPAKDEAKAAFARRGAIPGVLACVDGTLIAIMKPEGLSPADTETQDIPSSNGCLFQYLAAMPGSTSEDHYNREHASMRNVVERCSGVLKSKFRCLRQFRTLLYSPDRAARIIYACVALHNIALDAGDWTLDDYRGEVPPAEEPEEPRDIQVLAPHDVFLRGRQQAAPLSTFSEGHRNGPSLFSVSASYCHSRQRSQQ
ncbi:putative nuclease HARBI1 [Dermacentor andersoni]|uniref:putative nuclease HARBI1 n=1 Tax=Dermacentor andersoni TaxID=34620 RepID=UPI0024164794|nr:putative nuclease HARBI1 [Dermacentor andersoni]